LIPHLTKSGKGKRSDEDIWIVTKEIEVHVVRDQILHQIKVHGVYHPMTDSRDGRRR